MRMLILLTALCIAVQVLSQTTVLPREQVVALTADWKGDRLPDGRPWVSDRWLERLRNISLEEAWGVLRSEGYHNQFEGDWMVLHPDRPITGRALTAQYLPKRPDHDAKVRAKGKEEARVGNFNAWPIDMLTPGDLYIADGYGKVVDGTLIGDNLGNSIFARSRNGVVFHGSVRDIEGLEKIEGFNAWVKGYDPSYIQEMMLGGINVPIRIGRITVMPGDAILAKKGGVIAVPAHLVEKVVTQSEFIAMRDMFGHQRLREGRYTPGQIDQAWTEDIRKDFLQWFDKNLRSMPMTRQELEVFLKDRNW